MTINIPDFDYGPLSSRGLFQHIPATWVTRKRPTSLHSVEDYANAPTGTVVLNGPLVYRKSDRGTWQSTHDNLNRHAHDMAGTTRTIIHDPEKP